MKKLIFAAAALFAVLFTSAQEPRWLQLKRDSMLRREPGLTIPDSLAHMAPWKPDFRVAETKPATPAVSMTSVVVIQRENLPSRVTVLNNNTLRLGRHFNIGNGQAWNWSPFPDAYLDARTLSFPAPR